MFGSPTELDFDSDGKLLIKKTSGFVKSLKKVTKVAKKALKITDFTEGLKDLATFNKYLGELGPYMMIADLLFGTTHKNKEMGYLKEILS